LGGKALQVTEVRIADGDDLVERLTDMRVWLDEQRYEPSTFTYFFVPPGLKIRVSFQLEDAAKKFAERLTVLCSIYRSQSTSFRRSNSTRRSAAIEVRTLA
jgi:hypothetical protein